MQIEITQTNLEITEINQNNYITIYIYWEYKLVRSVILYSKMHLFQNKMNEQIN